MKATRGCGVAVCIAFRPAVFTPLASGLTLLTTFVFCFVQTQCDLLATRFFRFPLTGSCLKNIQMAKHWKAVTKERSENRKKDFSEKLAL